MAGWELDDRLHHHEKSKREVKTPRKHNHLPYRHIITSITRNNILLHTKFVSDSNRGNNMYYQHLCHRRVVSSSSFVRDFVVFFPPYFSLLCCFFFSSFCVASVVSNCCMGMKREGRIRVVSLNLNQPRRQKYRWAGWKLGRTEKTGGIAVITVMFILSLLRENRGG